MDITSDRYEERHVIDIEATYQGSRVTLTLQDEDTIKEFDNYFYIEFKNPRPDLLRSDTRLYKLGLLAIATHHRMQRYLIDGPPTAPSTGAEPDDSQTEVRTPPTEP